MELYASGFNAWGQLIFRRNTVENDDEPADLRAFTCVLRDRVIRNVEPFLTYTNVDTSSGTLTAGMIPKGHKELRDLHERNPGYYGIFAKASNDDAVLVDIVNGAFNYLRHYPNLKEGWFERTQRVMHESSNQNYSGVDQLFKIFKNTGPVIQLLAYETGFVALTSDGQVFTWGDERYAACLGRDVTSASPANQPGRVHELEDLPTGRIVKIAANGYLMAALTSGNDLYCWGGHPAQQPIIEGLMGYPNPVVIGEHDIVDVGVGDSHLIALTTDGQVFVIGDNKNDQLGLDVERATEWTRVDLGLHEKRKIKAVAAGPRSSFIVVEGLCP